MVLLLFARVVSNLLGGAIEASLDFSTPHTNNRIGDQPVGLPQLTDIVKGKGKELIDLPTLTMLGLQTSKKLFGKKAKVEIVSIGTM